MLENRKPLTGYFDALDGMRGLSILLVMVNHMTIPLPAFFDFIRDRGHLGVEVFFAVSGFLVMRSFHICLVKNKGAIKSTLYEFFVRRGTRIFFPYYFILTTIFLLSLKIGSLGQKVDSISDIHWSFPLYFYNYAKSFTSGQVPGSLNIMWSLSFEEQYYIFLGILFLFFRKNIHKALLVTCCISLGFRAYELFLNHEHLNFYRLQMETHLRLDAILWGCLAYYYADGLINKFRKNSFLNWGLASGTILAFYLGGFTQSLMMVGLSFTLTALFFTGLVIFLMAKEESLLARVFSNRVLTHIGRVSYEIYLLHQLVNAVLSKVKLNQSPVFYSAVYFSISILAASIMFRFLNQPIQIRLKAWLMRKPT